MDNYTRTKQKSSLIDSHSRAEVLSSIEIAKAFASEVGVSTDEYELEDEMERIALKFSLGCKSRADTTIDCSIFYYAAGVWEVCINFTTPSFIIGLPAGQSSLADTIVREYREKGFYVMYNSHLIDGEGSFTWRLSKTLPLKKATIKQIEVVFGCAKKACNEIMQKAEISFWTGFNSSYMDKVVMKDELWNLMFTEIDVFEAERGSITELHMESCGEVENRDITITISDNRAEIDAVIYYLSFDPRQAKCIIEKKDDGSFRVYGNEIDGVITQSSILPGAWVYEENEKKTKRGNEGTSDFIALYDSDGVIRIFGIKKYDRYMKIADVSYINEQENALDELNRSPKYMIITKEQYGRWYGLFVVITYLISGRF